MTCSSLVLSLCLILTILFAPTVVDSCSCIPSSLQRPRDVAIRDDFLDNYR